MGTKCFSCGEDVEVWEAHQLINKQVYCKPCAEDENNENNPSYKAKKFFRFNKEKAGITFLLYITMFFYNFVFFLPFLNDSGKAAETIAQIGFVVNFPILFIASKITIQSNLILILTVAISTILVLFWNYLISCELYYLYDKIIKK